MHHQGVQRTLQHRLEAVDQEIADLRSLLAITRRIERDAALRERLRAADLGFRLQDLWSGRLTGDALRRAVDAIDALAADATAAMAGARAAGTVASH